MVEEVKAYKTKDGKIWVDKAEAEAHDKELTRRDNNLKWVITHLGSYASQAFTTNDVVNALNDHGGELQESWQA
jgi:butyrate kinase